MTDAGGCYWRYKYRLGGKEKLCAIGTINDFTLAEAREEHDRARKCVLAGNDPVEMRRKDEANEETARQAAGSFREIARNGTAGSRRRWPARRTGHSTLSKNFNAVFDSKAITEVTIADLATVLRKHEKAGKFATRERDQARTRKVNAAAVALSNSGRSALRPD